ncbi:MAG TPA: hypothetical protein VIC30_04555, partial [Orrella sp.]
MPQDPVKKPGTLSLNKTRVADTPDGGNSNDRAAGKPARKPASVKTGARAHHRTRIQGEQRRAEPAPGAQRTGERKDDRTDQRNNERAGERANTRSRPQNRQGREGREGRQSHRDRQ